MAIFNSFLYVYQRVDGLIHHPHSSTTQVARFLESEWAHSILEPELCLHILERCFFTVSYTHTVRVPTKMMFDPIILAPSPFFGGIWKV